jgi:CO/xanthine dehydrogenase Mo-binding subunit
MTDPENQGVGSRTPKIDSAAKVTGAARYGSDIHPDGLLHAAVLRSTHPHGELVSVDASAAEALDGVAAVVERTDLMGVFDARVRHYGDIIAAVAADSRETARRALREIDYEIDEREAVFDPVEAARSGAPIVHENQPDYKQDRRHPFTLENDDYVNNIDDYHTLGVGDVEEGFAAADHVFEDTYESPRVNHCNLDTHCCVAEWEDETLVLTETLASPGRVQAELAEFFDLDADNIRIQTPPTTSSSFGGRSLKKYTLEPAAATLARETGRPVKLWFDREEEFIGTETRHETRYTIKLGLTEAGEITALRIGCVADTGAYPNGVGHIVISNSENRPLDLYRIPNYEYEGVSVFTNNIPGGEYRGIGTTQLTFALESHLDELARRVGLDPLEVRRRNLVEEGYTRPHTGKPIESCGITECIDRGLDRFDRLGTVDESTDADTTVRGWGLAVGSHTTASGTSGKADSSEARLTLLPDGTLEASVGTLDHGQGSHTVMAQIVAQETTIPSTDVRVERFPTTSDLEDEQGAVASRSTYIVGATVRDAARTLRTELSHVAAEAFDCDPDEVVFVDGRAGTTEADAVPLGDLVDEPVSAVGTAGSELTPPAYGCHLAEVEVDLETGHVDLLTYVAAQDVGYAINPPMVEGQLEGAVQHGVEFALLSELRLDRGVPSNANMADYPAISPHEMPDRLACELIESNEATGPYGAKGVGTPSMAPIAPAILNAVRDATGYRVHDPPIRDETLFSAVSDEHTRP